MTTAHRRNNEDDGASAKQRRQQPVVPEPCKQRLGVRTAAQCVGSVFSSCCSSCWQWRWQSEPCAHISCPGSVSCHTLLHCGRALALRWRTNTRSSVFRRDAGVQSPTNYYRWHFAYSWRRQQQTCRCWMTGNRWMAVDSATGTCRCHCHYSSVTRQQSPPGYCGSVSQAQQPPRCKLVSHEMIETATYTCMSLLAQSLYVHVRGCCLRRNKWWRW